MKNNRKILLLVSCLLLSSQLFFGCNPPRDPGDGSSATQRMEEGLRIFDKD